MENTETYFQNMTTSRVNLLRHCNH